MVVLQTLKECSVALKIALAGHEHEHEEDVRIIPRVWLAVHICLLHVNLLFLVINLKM